MRSTLWLAVPLFSGTLIVGATAVASAQGQVEQGPDHANSICSFSGLNDVPDDPVEGGRVQSFGQIVRHIGVAPLKASGEHPGNLCNGHKFPYPEAFGPPPGP